jgi:hypothetical protein
MLCVLIANYVLLIKRNYVEHVDPVNQAMRLPSRQPYEQWKHAHGIETDE